MTDKHESQQVRNCHLNRVSGSLHSLMTHSSKGFILTDLDHTIIDVNPAFEKLSGYMHSDLIGNRPNLLASPSHYNYMRYAEMKAGLSKSGSWKGAFINKRPNGEIWMAMNEICSFQLGEQTIGYWSLVEQNVLSNLDEELLYALERKELQIYYQPKYNANRQVVGAEALLRWLHPEFGLISPGKFIPMAEASGLILPIGFWVMQEVCAFSRWLMENNLHMPLSINISPTQLVDLLFVEHVTQIAKSHQVEPRFIMLEITESVLLRNAVEAIETITDLHELGFKISLDDFGTGYSSLSYLKDLTFDEIKIDRAFIRDMDKNENSVVILFFMIALAQQLERSVVAEGIESKKQFDFLQRLGCDLFQGFYFARPEPVEAFIETIRK